MSKKDKIEKHLESLNKILVILNGKKEIIGLDGTACSPLWGLQTDNKGEKFITEHQLVVINDLNDMPTVCNEVRVVWKDVTLATRNLYEQIENWKV